MAATIVNDNYSVPAGVRLVRLGVGSAGGLPAWITSATSRTWGVIPAANTLSAVDPAADPAKNPNYPAVAPWHGSSGILGAMNAWNGGCFDQSRGVFWINALGGHGNYFGNGSYKLDLARAAPLWSMVGAVSGQIGQPAVNYADGQDATGLYSDGRVRSTHSYNTPVYVPGVGPFLAGQTSVSSSGGGGPRWAVKFNETTGVATPLAVASASGASTPAAACYDPTRGAQGSIWRRWGGTSAMQRYDVAANTWSTVGSVQVLGSDASLTYLPGHDCILIGLGSAGSQLVAGGWMVFDCAAGTYHYPTFTGAPAINNPGTGGMWPGECQPVWVPSLGCACAWDNASATTFITTLTPGANPRTDAWTVGTLNVSGSNTVTPSAAQGNGTFGRFMFWPSANVFILLNAHDAAGFFFKL